MKKTLMPLLLFIIPLCSFTQVKNTVIKSAISFQIKNLGINTQGTIGGLQIDIHFNPADPAKSGIDATADVNTINTDNSSRDEHLKSEDYFEVARYPKITMKSVSIKHNNGNSYTGQFNITIKSKTKMITVPFSYTETGNAAVFKGSFKIKRSDFGIGSSSMILSDDVAVSIEVETAK